MLIKFFELFTFLKRAYILTWITVKFIHLKCQCLPDKWLKKVKFFFVFSEAPAYLIDLLQDNNKAIRKICNTCLNIISENNKMWAERIRIEKFRIHNAQWLQMVDSQQLEVDDDENDEDDELPPYLNTEYLSTAVVPPLSGNVIKYFLCVNLLQYLHPSNQLK